MAVEEKLEKLARARSFEAAYKVAGRCFLVVGKYSQIGIREQLYIITILVFGLLRKKRDCN